MIPLLRAAKAVLSIGICLAFGASALCEWGGLRLVRAQKFCVREILRRAVA